MLVIAFVMVFMSAFLLALGALYRPEAWAVSERLQEMAQGGDVGLQAAIADRYRLPAWERVTLPGLRVIGRAIAGLTPASMVARVQARLEAAGAPPKFGAREFIALRVLSLVVFTAVGLLLSGWVPVGALRIAWWALFVLFGLLLPSALLNRAVYGRQTAIRRSMPDILDLLVVSVEAGLGLDGAMGKVVEKVKGPLAEEFGRVLEEIRLGKSRGIALKDMARRVGLSELSSFVAALYQAEVLGVSVAHVLTVQAETVRERRSHQAREQAARLPVKLLFPLVFFIFPALFIVILGPGAIQIQGLLKVLGR